MKKLIYILILLFSFANGFSQKDSLEVYTVVEEMPEFPGGMQKLMNFLAEKINYPQKAKENGVSGKVFVKFVVNVSGKINDVQIIRSSGSAMLDSEAVRVVSIMPDWIPGKQNGKAVPVYFNLPINFKTETPASTGSYLNAAFGDYSYKLPSGLIFCDSYGNVIKNGDTKFKSLPEYPGGLDSLATLINKKKRFDADQIKNRKSNQAYVKFAIDVTGQVSSPEILVSSGSDTIDQEAIRLIKMFDKWKPAIKEGQAVKTYCKMPIDMNGGSLENPVKVAQMKRKADAYYDIGVKEFQAGNLENALVNFDKCLEINAKDIDALYNKGAVYLKLKNIDKACASWTKIKELGKTDADELITKYCTQTTLSNKTSNPVEKNPEFPGGINQFFEFLGKNLKPLNEVKSGKYIVFSTFMVQADGTITDIAIKQSCGNSLVDNEALRILSIMPKWVPGQQAGKNVPVQFDMPINFSL